jgi:predicted branched-subunit amino acid permease
MESATHAKLTFREGCLEGFPIFVGYFPTAMAFGLVCRDLGMRIWEAVLFSLTNFAGSGQFLAANLIGGGALLAELFVSVFMVPLMKFSVLQSFIGNPSAKSIYQGWN